LSSSSNVGTEAEAELPLDSRDLHGALLASVNEIQHTDDFVGNLGTLLDSLIDNATLPVIGGRVWIRERDAYRLITHKGGRKKIAGDYRIGADERILVRVRTEGVAFIESADPDYNETLERDLGVEDYAAIAFGDDSRYILSLDVTTRRFEDREQILGFLGILRHVMNRRLEADHYEWIVRETRDIQTSILPKEMPSYRDYDIHGESIAADREHVGGDLFDFITIDEGSLGLVIADASGHGLPAALMARDIRTAVHMAIIGEIKPTRMIARINRIVCEQAPLGRFISLFYGFNDPAPPEIYTVAGHPGLWVSSKGEWRELREGGPVLGIHPGAVYGRGVCKIGKGDLVCLYTDGVSEARDRDGEILGDDRIREILIEHRDEPSRDLVRRILDEAERFSRRQDDDRTVVVVRRPV